MADEPDEPDEPDEAGEGRSGAAAVVAAASLAACHLGDRRDDLAVVWADATGGGPGPAGDASCEPLAIVVAAVELSARALARVASVGGRPAADAVADIADGYARLVGREGPTALACYAAAMSVGGEAELAAALVRRCVGLHGELPAAVAATFVLAAAWRFQARDEGCTPERVAQRVALAGHLA